MNGVESNGRRLIMRQEPRSSCDVEVEPVWPQARSKVMKVLSWSGRGPISSWHSIYASKSTPQAHSLPARRSSTPIFIWVRACVLDSRRLRRTIRNRDAGTPTLSRESIDSAANFSLMSMQMSWAAFIACGTFKTVRSLSPVHLKGSICQPAYDSRCETWNLTMHTRPFLPTRRKGHTIN